MALLMARVAEPVDIPAVAAAAAPRNHVMTVHCRARDRLSTILAAAVLLGVDAILFDLIARLDQHFQRHLLAFTAANRDKVFAFVVTSGKDRDGCSYIREPLDAVAADLFSLGDCHRVWLFGGTSPHGYNRYSGSHRLR